MGLTMAVEKLDRKELIEVIAAKQGVISLVAQALQVSRQAIYDAAKRWPTVAAAIEDARNMYKEGIKDEAQLGLRAAVRANERWAIMYTLDHLGEDRGFGNKQKIQLEDHTVTFKVVYDR